MLDEDECTRKQIGEERGEWSGERRGKTIKREVCGKKKKLFFGVGVYTGFLTIEAK